MKSLSEYDLNLSVERGVWATQPHNEGILDQAFRTSKDVFLIFSANKSGEFFGYARMASQILEGERQVSWASRADSVSSSRSHGSPPIARGSQLPERILEEDDNHGKGEETLEAPLLFSPGEHRFAESSPAPISPGDPRYASVSSRTTGPPAATRPTRDAYSAPAELGPPHRRVTYDPESKAAETVDGLVGPISRRGPSASVAIQSTLSAPFRLDPEGPIKAVRDQTSSQPLDDVATDLRAALEGAERAEGDESWGTAFKVEWLRTERLSFQRTRNFRNPWNHDREVKVSRDGTELEPGIGQKLLDEWDQPDPGIVTVSPPPGANVGRRGTKAHRSSQQRQAPPPPTESTS